MEHQPFLLPDLGEGLVDAEIVRWLVAVGDIVSIDQPLVEVETAKANIELPSPFAGTVVALHGERGESIAVGAALVTIAVAVDAPAGARAVLVDAPTPGAPPVSDPVGDRPLVGYGDEPTPTRRRRRRRAHELTRPRPDATGEQNLPPASPPVRKVARHLGVDLRDVTGSGRGGRITRADVEAHAGPPTVDATAWYAAAPVAVITESSGASRSVRRAVAEKMARSHREIPDATTWVDCDATELLRTRERLAAGYPEVRITPLVLVLRACVAGLRALPELNARWDDSAQDAELVRPIHLGVAAQTERGLLVPVIRDADERTTLELATELHRLTAAARDGTISPAELVGSTFTVTNYGSFGVDGGAAIINHPEAAILGVGRFADKPWVHHGAVVVRRVVQLSLSFDHRVCDGGRAGGFLRLLADCVEEPATLLGLL